MPTATIDEFDLDIRLGSYDAGDLTAAATRTPNTYGTSRDYCCTDNCCTG